MLENFRKENLQKSQGQSSRNISLSVKGVTFWMCIKIMPCAMEKISESNIQCV